MGTAKKLTLTAGVAVLVAFAFMIGFVPAHDAATSRAADSEGRVDMAGLLDMIVGGEMAITAITPQSDLDGVQIVTTTTNAVPPQIPVANISALAPGGTVEDNVFYVLDGAFGECDPSAPSDGVPDITTVHPFWTGPLADVLGASLLPGGDLEITDPDGPAPVDGYNRYPQGASLLAPPAYSASLDLYERVENPTVATTAVYTLNALAVSESIYGLYADAAPQYPEQPFDDRYPGLVIGGVPGSEDAHLFFDARSEEADTLELTIDVRDDADADSNAIPDDLTIVSDRTLWLANNSTGIGGGVREVLVASLDLADAAKGPYDTVVLNPAGGVTVTLPTTDALKTAGVVAPTADQVLAVVTVADNLAAVVDSVDGDATEAARTAWAALAAKGDPVDARVVDISLVVNTGGVYSLLTNIAPLTATLNVMTGDIAASAAADLIVAGVPTELAGGVLTNGDPADWHVADADPDVDTDAAVYTATVNRFSAFVLLTPRYLLTTSVVGDGTIAPTPDPLGYLVGTTVELTATPAAGSKFDNWSGDASGTANPVSVLMDADKSVTANFSPISAVNYTVTVNNPPVGGEITLYPNLAQYPENSTVTVTANAYPGYTFTAWTDDLAGVLDNPASLVVNSNKTVGAVFTPVVKYTVVTDEPVNGRIALYPEQPVGGYVENTTVKVTATADAGFRFGEWTGALAGQPNPATLVMDGDKTIGANFLRNTVLTESDPAEIPSNASVPMILKGVFPTGKSGLMGAYQGLTRAEAEGRYEVYINNTLATFREVAVAYGIYNTVVNAAVTAIDDNDPAQTNEMYITSPVFDLADKAPVTVEIRDLSDQSITQVFTNIVTAVQYGVVTLTYSGSGTGTTTLLPNSSELPFNGGTIVLPAGTFAPGTAVTALAAADPGSVFASFTYAGNPVNGNTFTVQGGPADLNTKYDDENQEYTLTLADPANGTLIAAPAGPSFKVNTVVTLTATPNEGFVIAGWTGTGTQAPDFAVGPALLTATVKMTADKAVGVDFQPAGGGQTTYSLFPLTVVGGLITVSPAAPVDGYLPGTVVNVTATANTGYVFTGWTEDLAGTANPAALTMDADKVVGAVFTPIAVVPLTLSGISASEAWIFGGVTAKLTGTGLTLGTAVTVGGKAATTWNAADDGTSVDLLIPASDDQSAAALVPAQIVAVKGNETAALPFTYKRYATDAQGRNLTAFILNDPAAGNTVGLTIGVDNLTQAELTIPPLAAEGRVYGIVLNQRLELAAAKANTAAVPAGSLSGALIDAPGNSEGTIGGGYDFSVHLYTDPADKANTPPVEAQEPWLQDANALINFAPAVNPAGVPTASGMLLTFPLPLAQLTYGNVRTGLKWFGIESDFNYVTNAESYTDPKVVAYQSEVLAKEVDAAMTPDTADVARPDQVLKNRLYSLNGFSLRKGALLPDEVAAKIRLAKVDGEAVNGTGKGTRKGGTQLTLVSPDGGLGYVDRIVLKPSKKCFNREAGGTATEELFISKQGESEYVFDFKTPKSKKVGVVDLVIYLKADPTTPAATLTDVYEYAKPKTNWLLIILIVLGVAAAAGGIIAATA